MDRKERSCPLVTDAHIDGLLQDLEERQQTCQSLADAPELRIAHDIRRAYQGEAREDARSLERVLARLREDQVRMPSERLVLPHVSQSSETVRTRPHRLGTPVGDKSGRGWQPRAGLLVAAVLLTLLVGGLLTLSGVLRAGQTSLIGNSASQVVTSLVLSDNANQAVQASSMQTFAAGQTIWLTSMIDMKKIKGSGILTVKWYENDQLYATSKRDFQLPKGKLIAEAMKAIPVRAHQVFTKPGEGKVELYWNGQLVKVLHFHIK
jgi:hypothetical protein